jgi:hypothetical protein
MNGVGRMGNRQNVKREKKTGEAMIGKKNPKPDRKSLEQHEHKDKERLSDLSLGITVAHPRARNE